MKTPFFYFIGVFLLFSGLTGFAQSFVNYTSTQGLADNNVNGVAIDGNNIKWFGTQNGVSKFDDVTWTNYTTANGLIDNFINCIAVDHNNHVWVGTDYGVSKFDGTSWTSFTTSNGLVNNTISYIVADLSGNIWFATNGGVSKYNGTSFTNYTSSNGLPSDMITYIAIDSTGNKWFGTVMAGLVKYDDVNFTTFTTVDSLVDNTVFTIAIDGSGRKWAGTFYGISEFNSVDQWVANYRKANGLYNNYIKDMDIDSHGNLWIGSYADYIQDGAITRFGGSSFLSLNINDGLINPFVKRLACDSYNNVWIATGSGVSKLVVGNMGVSSLDNNASVQIYPNPAGTAISVKFDASVKDKVEICDVHGRLIYSETAKQEQTLNTSDWRDGMYFLRCGRYTKKIIVSHEN